MRLLVLALPLALAASGCGVSDCCSAELVSGFTRTNASGDVAGPVDADDWLVPGEGVPVSFVDPAYPNPTRGSASFRFGLDRPQTVRARLLDVEERVVVQTLFDAAFTAGANVALIERPASAPGLFRLEVTGDGWTTYGDILFE